MLSDNIQCSSRFRWHRYDPLQGAGVGAVRYPLFKFSALVFADIYGEKEELRFAYSTVYGRKHVKCLLLEACACEVVLTPVFTITGD